MTGPEAGLILHMPGPMAAPDGSGLPGYLGRLFTTFSEAGGRVTVRRRDPVALASMGDTEDVHLVWQGRIRHPRVLNTAVAYLFPFWYLDPQGVYGASSLVTASFDPATIDAQAAQAFFARQCNRLVLRRESRIAQKREPTALPANAIAIFLQGWSEPTERLRHMTEAEMVAAVLADTGGRPVIVKPHPNTADPETFELIASLEGLPGVTVTDANVHDMLPVADLSVSLCSSVALEGMLHRVPAVLFGRSDLHHCAETVRAPGDWVAARDRALARNWPFETFVHWFLAGNTINAGAPDLWARTLGRIEAATGIAPEALGLGALAKAP